jgi:glutathione S-transferase
LAEYRLYCFAQSGNAYKVALTLALGGASWEPRFVDFFNGETRGAEYRAKVNAMGEVPVLEHGGKRLAQSGVILHYLVEQLGRFGGANEDERREILRWILWDNHKLTSYIASLRFLETLTRTGDPQVHEFLRGRIVAALGILDGHLAARSYAVGERLTIADLSMCGYLFWPEEIKVDWAKFAAVRAWLERIRNQPGWVHPYQLMPGHPLPPK